MRFWFAAVGAALVLATAALAQSTTSKPEAPANDPVAPVAMSKRFACKAASEKFSGQDRIDQMQLCMAEARLDCVKQAIDQKIVSPQRKEFLASCTGQ